MSVVDIRTMRLTSCRQLFASDKCFPSAPVLCFVGQAERRGQTPGYLASWGRTTVTVVAAATVDD